jgi:hypothetical protein
MIIFIRHELGLDRSALVSSNSLQILCCLIEWGMGGEGRSRFFGIRFLANSLACRRKLREPKKRT